VAPGFHGYRPTPNVRRAPTPNERRAQYAAVFVIFAMQMARESRKRKAARDAQAAHDARVSLDAQAARAANANAPRVESGFVQAVQAVLLACFLLYVLYELARFCYSFCAQLLYDRRIALQIAAVRALVAHKALQQEPPAIVNNLTEAAVAAEERLPAIVNIPTAIVNRPTAAPPVAPPVAPLVALLEAPFVAIAISPTVDGDEGTQGASKKRGSSSSAVDNSTEKRSRPGKE
jgi:hypothetical protein